EERLNDCLARKRQIEASLDNLENQIFQYETSYLEDTLHSGNIARGFEGYLNPGRGDRKRARFGENERIFSMSSVMFSKA
ncbi:NuA4-domain-containing protein, partial [Ramicandelaber brevisporus]